MSLADNQAKATDAFFAAADRELVNALPPDPDLWVLEVGCGGGATGALALREGKCGAWIGLEADPRAAAEAMFALTDVIDPAPFAKATPAEVLRSFGEAGYGRAAFGLLVIGDALADFADPAAGLKALVPLLRPSGQALASVSRFREREIVRLLKSAGLKVGAIHAVGGKAGFLGFGRRPPERIEVSAKR
jgi:SAM-dependent methyltransferase